MDTRSLSRRKEYWMRHIRKMVLLCFESRALDLIICKQYKWILYEFLFFICLFISPLSLAHHKLLCVYFCDSVCFMTCSV